VKVPLMLPLGLRDLLVSARERHAWYIFTQASAKARGTRPHLHSTRCAGPLHTCQRCKVVAGRCKAVGEAWRSPPGFTRAYAGTRSKFWIALSSMA
jgi:hypothetical protein